METKANKAPLLLRVREDSEVGKILRAMQDGSKLTEAELQTLTGLERSRHTARRLATWFDNVSVKADRRVGGTVLSMRFVDVSNTAAANIQVTAIVQQQTVETVPQAAVSQVAAQSAAPKAEPQEEMRWPDAPRLLARKTKFDKPGWFETMRKMVVAGRHISLESAPGVGKDTAVEELAAEEGMPLVVVSGDGGLRARALVGGMSIANGSTRFDVAEFAMAVVKGYWCSITEVNAADADVLLVLNSLMAAPYAIQINGRSYDVHPDFRLFITYNSGLVGTKPLPQSTKDRFFSIKIPWFSAEGLRKRLEFHGLPGAEVEWANKVVQFGVNMWAAYESGRMRYQISTRRLIDAVYLANEGLDWKDAVRQAVVDAIDSPIESKMAKEVLRAL